MIGIDTNVVIRYLTQDDPKQSAVANQLIETELSEKRLGFISHIVLVEILWVLESCYNQKKDSLITVIESLLTTKQIIIERAEIVHLALKKYRAANADFSDALILTVNEAAGCERTVTFDKKAILIGMEKI
ncbi:MAG: type II toxin-antitoxin system VapC family toxin [Pseudomonadota bacterium]